MAASGKFWRTFHDQNLCIGVHEEKTFKEHYAAHGIHDVEFRKTSVGDLEPVIRSREHRQRMLKARGLREG